jgi:hypothetical protein
MRQTAKRGWGVILCGMVCLTPGPVSAQADALVKLWAATRPHLEAVGVRPATWPRLRAVPPDEFNGCPDPELEAQLAWQFADLKGDTRRQALGWVRNYRGAGAVARLCEQTGTIWVCPGSLPQIASWDKSLARADSPGLLQVALVRETIRYALDQRYHLDRLRAGCRDADSFQALQAVIEGRVRQLTRQLAGQMGLDADASLLEECTLRVPEWYGDPALRAVAQQIQQRRLRAAADGSEFWEYVQGQGAREEQVFAAPPRQLSRINRPDLYVRALGAARPDLAAVLVGLQSALPGDAWQAAPQPWSPDMVRQVAGLLGDRDRTEKVLAAWDEACSLVWTCRKDPAHQVAVSAVRFESPPAARAYFGLALDLQRSRDTLRGGTCTPSLSVLESRVAELTLRGADQAVRSDKRLRLGPGGSAIPVCTLLMRAGDLVLECSWQGLSGNPTWAERILAAFLAADRP